jgi:hypothetical protein
MIYGLNVSPPMTKISRGVFLVVSSMFFGNCLPVNRALATGTDYPFPGVCATQREVMS